MTSKTSTLSFALVVLTACGDGGKPPASPVGTGGATAGTVTTFFPLEEGKIYSYTTTASGETGMLVAKVHRTDATHGELRMSNSTKRFIVTPESVAYEDGRVLLKTPLDVGAAWPGEHGGTTKITSTDATAKVPAGAYAGCIQTVEEGGRPPGSRYTTTYCPGIGMVLLEVAAAGDEAKAELKSYASPVVLQ